MAARAGLGLPECPTAPARDGIPQDGRCWKPARGARRGPGVSGNRRLSTREVSRRTRPAESPAQRLVARSQACRTALLNRSQALCGWRRSHSARASGSISSQSASVVAGVRCQRVTVPVRRIEVLVGRALPCLPRFIVGAELLGEVIERHHDGMTVDTHATDADLLSMHQAARAACRGVDPAASAPAAGLRQPSRCHSATRSSMLTAPIASSVSRADAACASSAASA